MSERELTLKITGDRSQARKAIQEEIADLSKVREANAAMNAEKLRLMRQTASEQISAIRQSSQAQADALRQIRAASQLQHQEWRAQLHQKPKEDKAASDAMIYNLNQIRRSMQEMRAEMAKGGSTEALKGSATGLDSVKTSAGGAFAAVKGLGASFLGLNAVTSVLQGIVGELDRVRKAATDASKEVTGNRGDLRELAVLRGQARDTTATAKDVFNFRRQTGQSQQEAIQFQQNALGTAEAAIGRQVTREDFDKFQGNAAAYATMVGLDSATAGEMTGLMPSLTSKDGKAVDSDELTARFRRTNELLQMGQGSASQLGGQFSKNAPMVTTGLLESQEQLAALTGFFSLGSPESAGTGVEQFVRATVGAQGRMRGTPSMAGISEEDQQKQAEYIASLGAKAGDNPVAIGRMISKDYRAARNRATAAGEGFSPTMYFQSKGYGNQDDVKSLMKFIGDEDTYTKGFEAKANAPMVMGPDAMSDVKRFQMTDPMMMQRQAQLATEEAQFAVGAGGGEFANIARQQAHAQRVAQGKASGTLDEYENSGWIPGEKFLRRRATDQQAMENINAELPENMRVDTGKGWSLGRVYAAAQSLGLSEAWGAYKEEGDRRDLIGTMGKNALLEGGNPIGRQSATGDRANESANHLSKLVELATKAAARTATAPAMRPPVRPRAEPLR